MSEPDTTSERWSSLGERLLLAWMCLVLLTFAYRHGELYLRAVASLLP